MLNKQQIKYNFIKYDIYTKMYEMVNCTGILNDQFLRTMTQNSLYVAQICLNVALQNSRPFPSFQVDVGTMYIQGQLICEYLWYTTSGLYNKH